MDDILLYTAQQITSALSIAGYLHGLRRLCPPYPFCIKEDQDDSDARSRIEPQFQVKCGCEVVNNHVVQVYTSAYQFLLFYVEMTEQTLDSPSQPSLAVTGPAGQQ